METTKEQSGQSRYTGKIKHKTQRQTKPNHISYYHDDKKTGGGGGGLKPSAHGKIKGPVFFF